MGEWWYISNILDLGISWRGVISLTSRPLYRLERAPGSHYIGEGIGPRAGLSAVE
jgi:hypothetical protein